MKLCTMVMKNFFWMTLSASIAIAAVNLSAQDSCTSVHGTINSVFTIQNCTSPVGLCTVGAITGAGALNGSTSFVALDIAPSAGMPGVEPQQNPSYSGQLTIVTSNGTLVTGDLGVLDASHLANPGSTAFFISGSIVNKGQGFRGTLSGTLCLPSDQ